MSRVKYIAALAIFAQAAIAGSVEGPANKPVPAGAYQVDKAHTSLLFRVSHLGFSTFTGRFTVVDAKLQFDARNPSASQITADIDPRSIETDNAPSGFLQSLAGKD